MCISSEGLRVISSVHILAVLRYAGPDVYIVVALNLKLPLSSAYKEEIFFVYSGRLTRKQLLITGHVASTATLLANRQIC